MLHCFKSVALTTRTRLIDVSNVAASVGPEVCIALLGLHAFTGCDTVGAFDGKGKIRALTIWKANAEFKEAFAQLGIQWNLPPNLHVKLEEFVCKYHATRPATRNIDALRYNVFCAWKGDAESHQLPHCQYCPRKHAIRANYQAAIWRRSQINDPETPDPVGNGWKFEEQQLNIDWVDGSSAPKAVLNLLACKCGRSCKLPNCICLTNGLKCTDMCQPRSCTIQARDDNDDDVNVEVNQNDDADDEVYDDDYDDGL